MVDTQIGQTMNNPWYLKERHFHRIGTIVIDKLNAVMVCQLSEPRKVFVEHEGLGLSSKDRDLAEEHAQLLLAAPYAIRACYKLALSVLDPDFANGLQMYNEAADDAIQLLRQLEGKTL